MKKKGFTLIELLAVIIILGILMLIAIPSVTNYINSSRKKTYVSTANELVKAVSTKIASGDIEITDTDTTYYIDTDLLELENGKARSPYGDFEPAYVVVTYDGEEYTYYWTSRDSAGQGVKDIVPTSSLNETDIVSNIGENDIKPNVGIGSRTKIKIITKDGTVTDGAADYNVAESGGNRIDGGSTTKVCVRASKLHGTNCEPTYYDNQGHRLDEPIETCSVYYGNDPETRTRGVLSNGDAFDCDVNSDGIYDSSTERFYYMRECTDGDVSDNNCASLLYYTNVKDGEPVEYIYQSDATSWEDGLDDLPTAEQWSNPGLLRFGSRKMFGYNWAFIGRYIDYNNKPARYAHMYDTGFEYYQSNNPTVKYIEENLEEEDIGYWVGSCEQIPLNYEVAIGSFNKDKDYYPTHLKYRFAYTNDESEKKGVRPVINVKLVNMDY